MKTKTKQVKAPKKPSTPEQREKARARRWKKTGVSSSTIKWMKDRDML